MSGAFGDPADINTVLIETYWNVNLDAMVGLEKILTVLIETYWNVN